MLQAPFALAIKLMSSSKNLEYEKTSFLSKSNSAFIEEMYIRFIEKDPNIQNMTISQNDCLIVFLYSPNL